MKDSSLFIKLLDIIYDGFCQSPLGGEYPSAGYLRLQKIKQYFGQIKP